MSDTKEIAAAPGGIRFTVASRPQSRFSNTQTVSNLAGSTSFQPIPLPATGWVRKVSLYVSASMTCASAGAVVSGDAPFNLISGITLTDATGQAITQVITGYNAYLVNKFAGMGTYNLKSPIWTANPHAGPEYAYAATATTGTAAFRLDIDLEIDPTSGYGCIPNLDANASLQLKVDVAPYTNAWTGTTVSAASVSLRVEQHYWAPVGESTGGVANMIAPPGAGDYLETRYETQTVSASAENTIPINNRGGLIKNIIVVSRAAGVRTAFTAGSQVGLLYDNNAIDEGITLESRQNQLRRIYGYTGAAIAGSYAPLTTGIMAGLDNGVLSYNFDALSGNRDSWLNTRVGTLLQLKLTPGASATQLEIITQLAQVRDMAAFYGA